MVLSATVVLLTVFSKVHLQKATQEYSCCDLPMEMSLNRSSEYQFTIKGQSVAVVSDSMFQASPPFEVHKNSKLILNECVDFKEKIVFTDKDGYADENRIEYRSLPCNNQLSGSAIAGITIAAVILVVVIGVTIICKKSS